MADLKFTGRQFGEPSAPSISGATAPATALNNAIQTGMSKYASHVEEKRKAAEAMEASVLYADSVHQLNKQMIEYGTPENIAQGGVYQRYMENGAGAIGDLVKLAPEGHKKDLALKLKQVVGNNALRLLVQEKDYAIKQSKAASDIAIDVAEHDYKESVAIGNTEAAQQNKENIDQLYDDGITLGLYSKKDKYEATQALEKENIATRYFKRGENDALAGVAEQGEYELARSFPEDATNEDRILALQAYRKGAGQTEAHLESNRAVKSAQLGNGIAEGTVNSEADLIGQDVTQLQYENLRSQLIRQNAKVNNEQDGTIQALKSVQAGSGAQDLLTPKQKSGVYSVMAQKLQQVRAQETDNPEYQLDENDHVALLREIDTDVPAFTARMEYAALRADPEKQAALISQTMGFARRLSTEAPNSLKALDAKTRSVITMVNSDLLNSQGGDISTIITQARKNVNPDEPEQKARSERWQSLTKKDKAKLYKNVFGNDSGDNIDTFGVFQNKLALYNTTSDTIDNAVESVRQEMEPVYGKDRFFEPGKTGYLPASAAVPFSNVGHWYPNQIYVDLFGLTKRQAADPNIAAEDKLQWIYPELPAKMSQEKLMHENLHLLGEEIIQEQTLDLALKSPTLKARWKNQVVDIFYEADGMSRVGENNKVKYVFFIKDKDGNKEYITDPNSKDGSGYWVEYPKSLPEFLPKQFKKMNEEKNLVGKSYKAERAEASGTMKGTLKQLKEREKAKKGQLEKSLEQYNEEVQPLPNKKISHNIVDELLGGQ